MVLILGRTNGGADCGCTPASDDGWLGTGDAVYVNHKTITSPNFSITGTPTVQINSGGHWYVNGSLPINGGSWTIAAGGFFTVNGAVTDVLANSITINGRWYVTGSFTNDINITGTGSLRVDGTFTNNASIGSVTLPVELISFEAQKNEDKVDVTWTTASEINSDYYSVARSYNGVDFLSIGTSPAAGYSNSILNYSFVDPSPLRGMNYCQLAEYDTDGQSQKSEVVAVNFLGEQNMIAQIYPNPSTDGVSLYVNSSDGGVYQLNLTDLLGNTLFSAQIPAMVGENKFSLSLLPYPDAQYFVQLSSPSGQSSAAPIIKK
ncbi:MAG: T9SS type A sorting domain-containing protein [Flavobacteriales bacterium]